MNKPERWVKNVIKINVIKIIQQLGLSTFDKWLKQLNIFLEYFKMYKLFKIVILFSQIYSSFHSKFFFKQ